MADRVRLEPVSEENLEPLLAVAVAEATPEEVMPPVSAPAGWSHARREAFREFHRRHFGGLAGPTRTVMYAITVDSQVVGMIRLACRGEPGTMEIGMWLGQSARGQGIGVAAVQTVLVEAARVGARLVIAETTTDNAAALGALRHFGGRFQLDGIGGVRVELPVVGYEPVESLQRRPEPA